MKEPVGDSGRLVLRRKADVSFFTLLVFRLYHCVCSIHRRVTCHRWNRKHTTRTADALMHK
jgi:hypothetical protein